MEKKKFVYYEEATMLVGWLEEFPDYRTQGETLKELQENLKDIYAEFTGGSIPAVRRIGELVVGCNTRT
ncbi:MAG TPA: type II toxin-antitoxin system HicB family antitoxin [Candidatus Methylomirabilis sp.]